MLKVLPLVVIVSSFVATASAQQVGDKIVLITDKAPLRSGDAHIRRITIHIDGDHRRIEDEPHLTYSYIHQIDETHIDGDHQRACP
jgi:hypothetical protein